MKLSSFAVILALGTFVGCQEQTVRGEKSLRSQRSSVVSVKNIQQNAALIRENSDLTPSEKNDKLKSSAEELALAAEQLITPSSFMYADLVLDQALAIDAKNKRAQFYKAFLATPMSLRGAAKRIKPLAFSRPDHLQKYEEAVAQFPNSGLKTFLLDGKEDIKDESSAQKFLEEIYNAREKFRIFLKNNKNLELTLNLNDWGYKTALTSSTKKCVVKMIETDVYDMSACDFSKMMQVQLNRADVESIQHIFAGMQIYSALGTAYDVSGLLKFSNENQGKNLSANQIVKELSKNKSFGLLRHSEALTNISKLGMDGLIAIRWAASIQNELCPEGTDSPKNRDGYLFSKGLCVQANSQFDEVLNQIELGLSGGSLLAKVGVNDDGSPKEVEMVPVALLNNPIKDLKSLKPRFNRCDKLVSISDDTAGGLLPNGEANELLAENSDCYDI